MPASPNSPLLCDDEIVSSPRSPTLEEQNEEVQRLRAQRRDTQVNRWREESSTHLLDPCLKFCALLEEGCRYEISALRTSALSRPHDASVDLKELERDIRASYAKLLSESKRLFAERKHRGASLQELQTVAAQAVSSYSGLYPWSDGISCRDLTEAHPAYTALVSRNLIGAGRSGVTMMSSFCAALSCSHIKLHTATLMKQQRLDSLNRLQRPEQEPCQHDCTSVIAAADVHKSAEAPRHALCRALANAAKV